MNGVLPEIWRDSRMALWGLAVASALILGAALASQYFGGLAPCKLCLYQRWPYVLVIGAGGIGGLFLRSPVMCSWVIALCGLAFAVGAGIAIYHTGVEQGWFPGPTSCSGTIGTPKTLEALRRALLAAPVVRCDEIPWSMFGISLAGYNALASLALTGLATAAAIRGFKGRMR